MIDDWILKSKTIKVMGKLRAVSVAQNACFTDPHSTTICSSPGTVIYGSTNGTGQSPCRDDRGNQLGFRNDEFGNSSVELSSGEAIKRSQPRP